MKREKQKFLYKRSGVYYNNPVMIYDAIRLIAAALCGETKKTELNVTPDPALRPVLDFILLISAYAEISAAGKARVDPIARIPVNVPLRFTALPKDVFLLFAGIVSKLNVIFRAENVEGGITKAELQTLSDAMDGVLAYAETENGVALSAFSTIDGLNPDVAVSPVFAAGALLGGVLALETTTFRLGKNRNAPEVLCAVEAINAFGGSAKENGDGTVTVQSFRYKRFHPKTGKRLRKRAK